MVYNWYQVTHLTLKKTLRIPRKLHLGIFFVLNPLLSYTISKN